MVRVNGPRTRWGEAARAKGRADMLLSISSIFHPIPSRGDTTDNYQL